MAYIRASATLAERLARKVKKGTDNSTIRDMCDAATDGDMTAYQLDRLVNMVERRTATLTPKPEEPGHEIRRPDR